MHEHAWGDGPDRNSTGTSTEHTPVLVENLVPEVMILIPVLVFSSKAKHQEQIRWADGHVRRLESVEHPENVQLTLRGDVCPVSHYSERNFHEVMAVLDSS
jgi:hypothetical protein